MLSLPLYIAQRLTALLMAPMVLIHLALMIIAIQNGLSGEEILNRTRGSWGWAFFYGTFVVAAAIHAAIGLRVVLYETLSLKRRSLNVTSWGIAVALLTLGAQAVYAVYNA